MAEQEGKSLNQVCRQTDDTCLLVLNSFSFTPKQIQMELKNKKKMTFITDKGLYYYKVMSFDLKNIGVMY